MIDDYFCFKEYFRKESVREKLPQQLRRCPVHGTEKKHLVQQNI